MGDLELLIRMMDKYDVSKLELRQLLEDYSELEEEYGEAIKLIGQFEMEALQCMAFSDITDEKLDGIDSTT